MSEFDADDLDRRPPDDPIDAFLLDYREALKKRAGLRALVEEAQEKRKAIIAEQVTRLRTPPGKPGAIVMIEPGQAPPSWKTPPMDECEHFAKASDEYRKATSTYLSHNKALEHVEGEIKYMETRWETWRSRAANTRAQRMIEGRQ